MARADSENGRPRRRQRRPRRQAWPCFSAAGSRKCRAAANPAGGCSPPAGPQASVKVWSAPKGSQSPTSGSPGGPLLPTSISRRLLWDRPGRGPIRASCQRRFLPAWRGPSRARRCGCGGVVRRGLAGCRRGSGRQRRADHPSPGRGPGGVQAVWSAAPSAPQPVSGRGRGGGSALAPGPAGEQGRARAGDQRAAGRGPPSRWRAGRRRLMARSCGGASVGKAGLSVNIQNSLARL